MGERSSLLIPVYIMHFAEISVRYSEGVGSRVAATSGRQSKRISCVGPRTRQRHIPMPGLATVSLDRILHLATICALQPISSRARSMDTYVARWAT